MLTIFTIPKPFQGHIKIIQENAIRSWIESMPGCEIILMGDDKGVSETAKELGVGHVASIEKNEFGTPLLSSAFNLAQRMSKNDILMYINADIIFIQDLRNLISCIGKSSFLLCGRRLDMDIKERLDFKDEKQVEKLSYSFKKHGKLHGLSGLDYFIFPKNLINMPAFAVGRPGWDSWLIYSMRSQKIPVINATPVITAIHQNHDFSHSKFGESNRVEGPEWQKNIMLAGGLMNMMTLRDSDLVLDKNGLRKPDFPVRIFSFLSLFYPWRLLLASKRQAQDCASQMKRKLTKHRI